MKAKPCSTLSQWYHIRVQNRCGAVCRLLLRSFAAVFVAAKQVACIRYTKQLHNMLPTNTQVFKKKNTNLGGDGYW